MNSRERVINTLERKTADRIAIDMWATGETYRNLQAHLNLNTKEDVDNYLDIDMRWIVPDYKEPRKQYSDGTFEDHWGRRYKKVCYGSGSYDELCGFPLADARTAADVENKDWPKIELWDFDGMVEKINRIDEVQQRWIGTGESSIFERTWAQFGLERFLCDLAMNPEIPCRAMDIINELYIEHTLRTLRTCQGRIDMIYTADDVGTQNGMMLSPDMWRTYIKPRQKYFNESIRKEFPGIKIFYHCCGSIREIIEDLIDIGVDILNPIQPKAKNMDARELKALYADKLTFHGGFDTQDILPNATLEQIREETRQLINILGNNGGYILAPPHSIQPDVPVEKILVLYDEAKTISYECKEHEYAT